MTVDVRVSAAAPPDTRAVSWRDRIHPIVPWLIACALLLPLPLFLKNAYIQFVVNVMCINIILAVGLNIVKGFAGQVTVGHVALAAIGAYSSAVFSKYFGIPFWGALPLAMLVTAGAGALVGIPSLRLEGAYLALATLGLANRFASSFPARNSSAPPLVSRTSRHRICSVRRSAITGPTTMSSCRSRCSASIFPSAS